LNLSQRNHHLFAPVVSFTYAPRRTLKRLDSPPLDSALDEPEPSSGGRSIVVRKVIGPGEVEEGGGARHERELTLLNLSQRNHHLFAPVVSFTYAPRRTLKRRRVLT
jgi:hypothetical protein